MERKENYSATSNRVSNDSSYAEIEELQDYNSGLEREESHYYEKPYDGESTTDSTYDYPYYLG